MAKIDWNERGGRTSKIQLPTENYGKLCCSTTLKRIFIKMFCYYSFYGFWRRAQSFNIAWHCKEIEIRLKLLGNGLFVEFRHFKFMRNFEMKTFERNLFENSHNLAIKIEFILLKEGDRLTEYKLQIFTPSWVFEIQIPCKTQKELFPKNASKNPTTL